MENAAVAEADNDNRKLGPVTIHLEFAKSFVGIAEVVAAVTSLIAFICVDAGGWVFCTSLGPIRFFEFVSMSSFWAVAVLYFAFLTGLNKMIKFIAWDLTTLVWSSFHFGFYLISSSVLAANTCRNGSLAAGAVFGFFSMIAFGVIMFFTFQDYRKRIVISRGESNEQASHTDVQYSPEDKY